MTVQNQLEKQVTGDAQASDETRQTAGHENDNSKK